MPTSRSSCPGMLGTAILVVQDGGRRGWRRGSLQWEVGRQLLDSITPTPGSDAGALLWYRAVSAHLFREGNLAELAAHLDRARQVFPQNPNILLRQCLSASGAVVAGDTSIDSAAARRLTSSVAVSSRRDELQRAERFLREALVLAPGDADGRIRLGHTLGELGRHGEAAAELRRRSTRGPIRGGSTWQSYFSAARKKR